MNLNKKVSFPKEKIKILLLENISKNAFTAFEKYGYTCESLDKALEEKELEKIIADIHILGIRSKTNLSKEVLAKAKNLLAIGCFCIGTNQVDLTAASLNGIPVFNAPFSNTRSVAEMTVGLIVMLARKIFQRSSEVHQGIWNKSASQCYEVKGKKIGIIGYGNIGPQVGLLAESYGMDVLYYDIAPKLPLGKAISMSSLEDLLKESDFVSLHVPENETTINLIKEKEIALMTKGACLINLSRGRVVDLEALANAIKSKNLGGCAVDVFPIEPAANTNDFTSILQGLENTILTPHIGGSTIEAQEKIGLEVSKFLLDFLEVGNTTCSVNFPSVDLPYIQNSHRILNIHVNKPGVLSKINNIVSELGANVNAQYLKTNNEIGYLIMDVNKNISKKLRTEIQEKVTESIKTRLLY